MTPKAGSRIGRYIVPLSLVATAAFAVTGAVQRNPAQNQLSGPAEDADRIGRLAGSGVRIHAFITQDSPKYASVVVRQLIAATDQLAVFPESGRAVPEFDEPQVREIVRRPYRIGHSRRVEVLEGLRSQDGRRVFSGGVSSGA